MMRAAAPLAGVAGVVVAFLVIPGGGASLIAFEVLLLMIVMATARRVAPPDAEVDGPGAPRFNRSRIVAEFPSLPRSLRRVERLVRYGKIHAHSAGTRLVPTLRRLAADRLRVHHNVDLASQPGAARALLGAEAWELLRPDWERTTDPSGPGPSLHQLEVVVASIEHLEPSR